MLDKSKGESSDLQSIGELIYQLIFYESFRTDIQKGSSKWDALGTKKEQWQDLCYDLLHTKTYTLEKLTGQLSSLKPKSKLPLWIASLSLIFISILVWLFFKPPTLKPTPFDHQAWQALCQEHSWFFSLNEQLRKDWGNNRNRGWQHDPQLKAILDSLQNVWKKRNKYHT